MNITLFRYNPVTRWHIVSLLFVSLLWIPPTATASNIFQNQDLYTGSWQTTRQLQNFPFASTIMFELWPSQQSTPMGVGILISAKQVCRIEIGYDQAKSSLSFKTLDHQSCGDLDTGYFKLRRQHSARSMLLAFEPDRIKMTPNQTLASSASYRRLNETPGQLRDLVRLAKKSAQSIEKSLANANEQHAKYLALAQQSVVTPFSDDLSEPELLGVWSGQFVDKNTFYPAEIAFWSSKINNYQTLAGIVHFENDICDTEVSVRTSTDGLFFSFNSTPAFGSMTCEKLRGLGQIELSNDQSLLVLRLKPNRQQKVSMKRQNCIHVSPASSESSDCKIIGNFKRKPASESLNQTIATIDWSRAKNPVSESDWSLIKTNTGLSSLKQTHIKGTARNAELRAIYERDLEDKKKQRELADRQRIAKQRVEKAAQAERREQIKREWEQRTRDSFGSSRNQTAYKEPLPKLPKISGPFDSLDGSDYFNALYHGNFAAVATFERYYRQRKLQQRQDLIGDHWMNAIIDKALKEIRVVDSLLAIYLFNFDTEYKACLKDETVTFEVVEVIPDQVIENMVGVEVARIHGWKKRSYFTINPEFTQAFQRIGTTKPDAWQAGLSDFLLNSGGTDIRRQVLSGTKQLIKNFSCDSDEIKQLESSLVALGRPP